MNNSSRRFQPIRFLLTALVFLTTVMSLSAQALFDINFGGGRSHPFDVLHVAIDVRFDEPKKEVIGTVVHRIRSLDTALSSVRLDAAANMILSKVMFNGTPARYELVKEVLTINLPSRRSYGDTFTVAIDYRVVPEKGLYFIRPDSLRPDRRHQIWTQGEAEDNHFWVPIYDYPNDQATSEVTTTVSENWKVLSNGDLKSMRRNGNGTSTWHYSLDKPHASYLIMLAAGDYLVTRDSVEGVALQYWTYPDMPERVEPTFGNTPDIIRYLERLVGIRFPWKSYSQIMIAEFMYGGMENTTATTLADYLLVDRHGRLDYNPDNIIAHEAAHQWYGDLVTNRDWGHLWLHESSVTYMAARYMGYRYGDNVFRKMMYDNGQTGLKADETVGRDPLARGRGVTSNLYQRGSRVLHMLNTVVGEELFWHANRLFLNRHAHGLVETNDLKLAFEDATGLNLDWFFDQWVYSGGAPSFLVDYIYERDSVRLHVRQVHTQDSLTGLFRMPVPIEAYTSRGVVRDTVWVSGKDETFAFAVGERPRFVIFDAGDVMLKHLTFMRSEDELVAQLGAPRMIDRLFAVQALADSSADVESTTRPRALRELFAREGSPEVREEIVNAIVRFDASDADDVIVAALSDTTVDIRKAAAEMSYRIADRDRRAMLLQPLLSDSSLGVRMATISMLAATRPAGLEPYLRQLIGVRGRRDRMASAWLSAVTLGKFTSLVDGVITYTSPGYSRYTRAEALSVLSQLDTTGADVRRAIERGLRDKNEMVFSSALSAARAHLDEPMRRILGDLRDELNEENRNEVEKLLSMEQPQSEQ